jgi:hypothetical protein
LAGWPHADHRSHLHERPLAHPQTPTLSGPFEKVVRLAANPIEKSRHLGMLTQRLHVVIIASKLALTEEGMQLAVTDAVQPSGLHPSAGLGHQVVSIALAGGIGRSQRGQITLVDTGAGVGAVFACALRLMRPFIERIAQRRD